MSKSYCFLLVLATLMLKSCVTTNVYEKRKTVLYQDEDIVSVESTFIKDGKLKDKSVIDSSSEVKNIDSENLRVEKTTEKVTVESKTNAGFVAYTFLGKPFVIAGCVSLELLKSCGYALGNLIGGYNTLYKGKFFWMMPDVKGSLEKAKYYKEQNRIKVYPEYHKTFTNNKTTVSKIIYEAETIEKDENEMNVISKEEYEYDNTLSVSLSALADAHETCGIVGAAGAIITVPISVGTWILGAVYGLCKRFGER